MKSTKKVIHIVKHTPTGAKVPIMINKMNGNVIEEYAEVLKKRRGFTVAMLQNRWDKCREDVIEILQEFQVPGHLNHQLVKNLQEGQIPLDVAVIFEEYVLGIEAKTKMKHSKLKSKLLEDVKFH